jgi:hypothetical protein
MTETVVKRPSGTWRRRTLIVVIAAVLLLLLVRGVVDTWAGSRIKAAVWHLEQQHGSLDLRTLNLPSVPEGENRARAIRAAAALINYAPLTSWSEYQSSFSAFMKQQPTAPMPADLRAFVDSNRATFRVVEDARSRPQSNWEADYAKQANVPSFLDIRTLSNAIYLATLLDLEAGRPNDAARSIASGLAMAASLRQEPWLVTQLIRVAVSTQNLEAVQRLLMQSEPSSASLGEVAKWLAENRTPDPMHLGMLSELKYIHSKFPELDRAEGLFEMIVTGRQPRSVGGRPLDWVGRPWVRVAWVECLEQMGQILERQKGPRPRPASRITDQSVFCPGPALERVMDSGDHFNSGLGLTELAVALRRFRLEHGQYPEALSALVPRYVPSVPIDALTGKAPVYSRQGAGFRLQAEKGKNAFGSTAAVLDWNVLK